MTAETPKDTTTQEPTKSRKRGWGWWIRSVVTAWQVWRLADGSEKAAWVVDALSGLL